MNITYACPHCHALSGQEFLDTTEQLDCIHCQHQLTVPQEAIEENQVKRCLVCPSTDLFVRKDFPQRVGVAIVAFGIISSSIAWGYGQVPLTFAFLFGTALVDVVLYAMVGEALMCYRCHAQYRGTEEIDVHGPFELETHEKHRQITAKLAMGSTENKLATDGH